MTAEQRRLDAQTDAQVAQVLRRKVDAMVAQGHNEQVVIHNFAVEFVDVRTEAILLRDAGWDVVPLLLKRPALAFVVDGHVVAVRDWRGGLSIHPLWRGKLNHLHSELREAEERVLNMREVSSNKGSPASALNTLRLALREHGLGDTEIARVEATVRPSLEVVASSGAPLLKYALAMWKRARASPPRARTPPPRARTPTPRSTRNRRT